MNTIEILETLSNPEPLIHLGLLRISGKDAEIFLQGQLTCDVKSLTEESSIPAAYCSPKGRAIASFQVIKKNKETFLLILANELIETVHKRLKLFVMRSKVDIEALTAPGFISGLVIEPATSLPCAFETVTDAKNVISSESEIALKLPGNPLRFMIISERASPSEQRENNLAYYSNRWILNDIENGLPLITTATSEEYIPQMFNLDLLGGISFKKGCYTGQEIIARMHYLGKLKQRTFLASTECSTLPEPATPVFYDEQKVGSILMAARDEKHESKVKLLVVLQLAHAEDNIYLKNSPNSPLVFEDLPYTFDCE